MNPAGAVLYNPIGSNAVFDIDAITIMASRSPRLSSLTAFIAQEDDRARLHAASSSRRLFRNIAPVAGPLDSRSTSRARNACPSSASLT